MIVEILYVVPYLASEKDEIIFILPFTFYEILYIARKKIIRSVEGKK